MKTTKLLLAALAVTFSVAMMSCTGNKTTANATEGEGTTTETVAATTAPADSCCCQDACNCQTKDSCCQATDSCAVACDKKADCACACCAKK